MRYSGLQKYTFIQFSFFFLLWPVELLISPWRLKSEVWVGLQEVWRLDSARNVQLPCFWSGGEPFSHVSWAPPFPVFSCLFSIFHSCRGRTFKLCGRETEPSPLRRIVWLLTTTASSSAAHFLLSSVFGRYTEGPAGASCSEAHSKCRADCI